MAQTHSKRKDETPGFGKKQRTILAKKALVKAQQMLLQGATYYNLASTRILGINRKGDCLRRIR
jgi:hypothetical protein